MEIGTEESTRLRWQLPRSEFWEYAFAYVFFASVFIGQTVRFYAGSEPLLGAQPAQVVVPVVGFALATLLWLASPVSIRLPSGLPAMFFGLLLAAWAWGLFRDWGATDLTAFTLGPFVAMVATKTPKPGSAIRILYFLGVLVLILFASAAIFAVVTDVPPTGYVTKWPPLTNSFSPIGMWWAPFNGPAESGTIGAVLIVLGLCIRNGCGLLFIVGGSIILFYAGTLAAAMGLGVAVLVLLFGMARSSSRKRQIQFVAACMGVVALVMLGLELARNPTLSSRTYIWGDFVTLIRESPLWGWGSAALIQSEVTWTFPWGDARTAHGSDAHNLVLDAWVRYGVVGLSIVTALVVVLAVAVSAGWKSGRVLGPALISMILIIGVTETNLWWVAPGTIYALLLLGFLASFGPTPYQSAPIARPERSGTQ